MLGQRPPVNHNHVRRQLGRNQTTSQQHVVRLLAAVLDLDGVVEPRLGQQLPVERPRREAHRHHVLHEVHDHHAVFEQRMLTTMHMCESLFHGMPPVVEHHARLQVVELVIRDRLGALGQMTHVRGEIHGLTATVIRQTFIRI